MNILFMHLLEIIPSGVPFLIAGHIIAIYHSAAKNLDFILIIIIIIN